MSDPLLKMWSMEKRVLLAVAAPAEAKAVLAGLGYHHDGPIPHWRRICASDRFELVLTGVGKANAAGGAARACDPARHSAVVSVGVAGALPGSNLPIGSVVLATESVYADEGVITPGGFVTLTKMGFPPMLEQGASVAGDPKLIAALESATDRLGVIATVSTCSGTDVQATEVERRTGAVAEAMEGAAVGCAIERINAIGNSTSTPIAFAELRIISNTTGDRASQQWDLAGALNRLTWAVGLL